MSIHVDRVDFFMADLTFFISIFLDFVEKSACGVDSLILCEGVCRDRSAIACNGVRDCSDWYDEFQCPGRSVTCDFESSQLCGYTKIDGDGGYSWVYNSGETPTPNTGPDTDHTYGNDSGEATHNLSY